MGAFLRILIIIASVFLVGVGIVIYLVYNSSPAQQKVLEEKSFTEDIEAMEIMVDNSRVETMPSDGASSRIMLLGNGDGFSLNTKAAGGRLAIEVEDRPPRSSISTLTAPIRCKFMCLRAGSIPYRLKAATALSKRTAASLSNEESWNSMWISIRLARLNSCRNRPASILDTPKTRHSDLELAGFCVLAVRADSFSPYTLTTRAPSSSL